jgi:hypothetical protein
MADAIPVKVGKATEAQKPRNTGRPIRAGLVQEKLVDGTPVDKGDPKKRLAYKKHVAARKRREEERLKAEKAAADAAVPNPY